MPVSTFIEEADEELEGISLLALPAAPFPLFRFSLHLASDDMPNLEIPRSEADTHADLELPWIQDFLSTACKPDGLDEVALHKFLK